MNSRSSLFVLTVLALFVVRAEAADLVLLDNTDDFTANLSSSAFTWGSNSLAYSRINGYTFQVGATSYDATAVTIPIRYTTGGPVTPNMRIQVWELPDLSATFPAGGAVPFYTMNVATNTFDSTFQYFTFPFTNGTLNLKANTRYSIGFLTDQLTNPGFLEWSGFSPTGSSPSGSYGLSSVSPPGFVSSNGGTSFSGFNMNYGFQLTGVVAVPEPSTWVLGGMSVLAMALGRKRFRKMG